MTPAIAWLLGIAAVLVVVALVVVGRRKERERTEAFRRLAETAGLAFQPKAELPAVRSLAAVPLFDRGHSKKVANLMTGRVEEQEVAVFDYRYTTGSGKHQSTSVQTVILVPGAKPSLPDLQMAPENPLTRLIEVFGYQDIDIESSPEFSRRYIVKGTQVEAIRAALYPGAASYFAEHEGWTVETRSGAVAIYRANHRPKAEQMQAFLGDALAAVRSL